MAIDRSSWLWRKGRPLVVSAGVLLAAGWLLQPLQSAVWQEVRTRQPALNLPDMGESLGQGSLIGVLGGFRSIIADFVWLKQYTYWEKGDVPNTEAYIALAATIDPNNLMFWDEGSSMIGLDIPSRRIRALPLPKTDAEAEIYKQKSDQIIRVQAQRAIELLERGLKFKPNSYTLLKNEGQLYQNRLSDLPHAAEKYRQASENTTMPYLMASSYVRLMRQMGRSQEAYDYLVKLYPTLPKDLPEVQKGVMWGWIRGLEDELKIPTDKRLPDSMAPPGWNAADYMDDFRDMLTPIVKR